MDQFGLDFDELGVDFDKLERDLEILNCSICLEEYASKRPADGEDDRRPTVTPCGHSVCVSCANGIKTAGYSSFKCPMCRKQLGTWQPVFSSYVAKTIEVMSAQNESLKKFKEFQDGNLISRQKTTRIILEEKRKKREDEQQRKREELRKKIEDQKAREAEARRRSLEEFNGLTGDEIDELEDIVGRAVPPAAPSSQAASSTRINSASSTHTNSSAAATASTTVRHFADTLEEQQRQRRRTERRGSGEGGGAPGASSAASTLQIAAGAVSATAGTRGSQGRNISQARQQLQELREAEQRYLSPEMQQRVNDAAARERAELAARRQARGAGSDPRLGRDGNSSSV